MRFNALRFCVGFSVALLISMVFFGFTIGDFTRNYYPSTSFNGTEAHYHHIQITQGIRQVGKEFYNSTHRYFIKIADDLKEKSKTTKNTKFDYELYDGSISHIEGALHHRQNDIKTVIYHLIPTDPELAKKKPLAFSAHWDGHNVGETAYDNAINTAMIMELACSVINSDEALGRPVDILLIGSEEFGMSGAQLYVKKYSNNSHILNLDSLGTGQPFALLIKGKEGASVELSLARTPGVMLATFGSFFMTTGVVSSSTDHSIYEAAGMTGCEMDFIGNPSHYHTSLDKMRGPEDITAAGNQLMYFMLNFKEHSSEKEWAGIGISPIIIMLPNIALMVLSIICFIAVIAATVVVVKMGMITMQEIGRMFAVIGSHLLLMIVSCVLVYAINTCSYAGVVAFAILSWFTLSCCAFLGFADLFGTLRYSAQKWHMMFTLWTAILAGVLSWNDLSLPYLWMCVISSIAYLLNFLPKKYHFTQWIVHIIAAWPLIYEYILLFNIVMRYSPVMPGVIPELIGALLMWLMTTALCLLIMSNSSGEEHMCIVGAPWKATLGTVFTILVVLFVKSPSYSNEYVIKGSCAHMIFENQTSHISYIPSVGSRVGKELKKLIHLHDNHYYESDFSRPYASGPAVVQRFEQIDRPDWIEEWPTFTWTETSAWNGKTRNMTFFLDSAPTDMDSVAWLIDCPNAKECVEGIETWDSVVHEPLPNIELGMFVRVTPVYAPFNLSFTFKVKDPVSVQSVFVWGKRTKERDQFFEIFPSYVQHTMKMGILADTVLVNETHI